MRDQTLQIRSARVDVPGEAIAGHLYFYPAGLEQPLHEHDAAHISFLLLGSFEERVPARADAFVLAGQNLVRKAGAQHGVRFGPRGALILSVHQSNGDGSNQAGRSDNWNATGQIWAAAAGARSRPVSLALDSCPTPPKRPAREDPCPIPAWLVEARQVLLDRSSSLSLTDLALEFGVHRVHLSRQFERYFGARPTTMRLRTMAGQALSLVLSENQTLASSALAAGFSDQAHFSRVLKSLCGMSPNQLCKLLT